MPDSSVPEGASVHEGWILSSEWDENDRRISSVITENAFNRYNALIRDYRLQLEQDYKVKLKEGDGCTENLNSGSAVRTWTMKAEFIVYFARMNDWSKNGRAVDSTWMKIKNAL